MTRNIMIRAYHFHESLIHAQAIICKQMISFLFSVFFRFCSEKLQLALAARERAEKKQQEYEDRLKQMQEDMERSQRDLLEAQDMIRRLEEQLKQLQAAKDELELRQKELQAMLQRLEEAKNMEAVEKLKLEEEIMAKQMEVQRIQDEVNAKDEETKRLQDEVEDARRKQVIAVHFFHYLLASKKPMNIVLIPFCVQLYTEHCRFCRLKPLPLCWPRRQRRSITTWPRMRTRTRRS